MRKLEKTQTDTAAWAADSSGITTDVEKLGVMTRLAVTAEVTPSATFDGANQTDGLWRIIQNLRLEGGAGPYFALPADDACMGGTLLHYMNAVDHGLTGHASGDVTAPQLTYVGVSFILHPGSRPKRWNGRDNPYDLSAIVPALYETALRTVWVTSSNDVMDDTVTISSAVLRHTQYYITGLDSEIRAEMTRQGVAIPAHVRASSPTGEAAMMPQWTTEVFPHTATASDYGEERNITVGGYLRRICIAEQDATGDRSIRAEDQVTGIKIKINEETIVQSYVDHWTAALPVGTQLEEDEAAADFGGYAPAGILMKDLTEHGHPDYGVDLTSVAAGAAKLGLTIGQYASGDDSLILYDRVVPYFGKLGH